MRLRVRLPGWVEVRRFFNIVLGAVAMVTVALVSAFIAMRLAIHAHEVKVPDLSKMTISEASRKASSMGLRLQLENRFYSPATPAGQVLAQYPAAGTVVRRQWPVRVTESLGPQQVSIPNLIGQGERSASIHLKQLGLEIGAIGHIPVLGADGEDSEETVVAQSPLPNARGADSPRVSVLLSAAKDADVESYVMPSLIGLSLSSAFARSQAAGLRIVSAEDVSSGSSPPEPPSPTASIHPQADASLAPIAMGLGVVTAQSPLAGRRVSRGDAVHLTLMR